VIVAGWEDLRATVECLAFLNLPAANRIDATPSHTRIVRERDTYNMGRRQWE